MNPNKAFKAKNNKFIVPNIRLIFGTDRQLDMTCRNCHLVAVIHVTAHKAFKPTSVVCDCDSNDWIWVL